MGGGLPVDNHAEPLEWIVAHVDADGDRTRFSECLSDIRLDLGQVYVGRQTKVDPGELPRAWIGVRLDTQELGDATRIVPRTAPRLRSPRVIVREGFCCSQLGHTSRASLLRP